MTDEELEREARRVLEPLRYSPVAVASPREVESGRVLTVPRLARLIEGVPRERLLLLKRQHVLAWLRYTGAGVLAVAATSVLWLSGGSEQALPTSEAPQLVVVDGQLSHKGTALSTGVKYAIGSLGRLSTPLSSGAKFVTNEGVRIGFAADSTVDLSFAGDTRRIALNRGKIQLSVPKLEAGTALSVTTPDAVVTVHGTRFSVEIGATRTCVRVTEGLVSVARGADLERLASGQASGCSDEPRTVAVSRRAAPSRSIALSKPVALSNPIALAARAPARAETAPEPGEPGAERTKTLGTLTQENELFRSALAAEQSGNLESATALARRLLIRYPNSPMAPDARRILSRLKEKQGEPAKER